MEKFDYRDSSKKYPKCNYYYETSPNVAHKKDKDGVDCELLENIGFNPDNKKVCPAFYCELCIYDTLQPDSKRA